MDEVLDIPEVQDAPPQEQQSGDPVLAPEHRQKLDSIVVDLYRKKAPKEVVQAIVNDFKTKYAKSPQSTNPAIQSKSLITPAKPKDFNALQTVGINNEFQSSPKNEPKPEFDSFPVASDIGKEQYAHDRHREAVEGAVKTISGIIDNDKVLKPIAEKMLIEDRQRQLRDAASNVNVGATDHPVNIPTQFGLQVQPHEVDQFTHDIKQNPELQVQALLHEKKNNPKEAGKIDKALYIVHANDRAVNADKQVQIAENANKIENGELKFEHGKLIKPEGLGESLDTASKEREDDIALFDLADNGSDDDVIKKLNELNSIDDPDNAKPTPTGIGGAVGEILGGQGKVMSQVMAAQALNAIPVVGTAAAESISGGLFAHEMARRGYAKELRRSYGEYKRQGLSDHQALEKAKEQAKRAMVVDAGTAALMGYATGAAGSKLLKAVPEAEAMANTIKANKLAAEGGWYHGVIKNGFKFIKKEAPAAISNATLAGGGEMLKNASAEADGGINRDQTEGVADAAINMAKLHYTLSSAYALLPHILGSSKSGAKTLSAKVMQGFTKVPIEDAKAIGQDLVKQELITPQQNAQNIAAIEAQKEIDARVSPKVTNDETRLKLHDWEVKLQAAEEEKKTVGSAYKEEAQKEIDRITDKIKEIANSPEAKEESPKQEVEKPRVTVSTPNIVNVKLKDNAVPIEEPGKVGVRNEATVGEEVGSGNTEPKEPTINSNENQLPQEVGSEEKIANPSEGDKTGITHEQMNETAREFGLTEYEGSPETQEKWNKQADERFKKDPEAMSKLLNKMRDGGQPDAVEQKMMAKYIADLKAKVRVNPSDELLTQLKRAKDLSNIVGGRDVAKSLVARQGDLPVEETLPDYLVREMEVNKVDKLTEEQKKNVTKEFTHIDETQKELNDKVAKLEAENTRLKAEKAVKKISSETKKVKKTHEDFVKERKSYIDELKDLKQKAEQKLKDKGIHTMGANFTFNGDMAKVVGKMVKSLVEEGVEKLEDIVKNIHGQLKDVFEGMEEKDVHDIIAGAYNEKKSTRNELAAKLVDIKMQAKLINELERLQKGDPKTEKQRVKRNKEVAALQKQIKDFKEENPDVAAQLKALKTRSESELKKVEEQIKKGDFGPDEKKVPILENKEVEKKEPKLFKDALDAKDKLVKAKIEREVRLIKQQYAHEKAGEKVLRITGEALNVPRTIMSSMDFSAPLRQGLVAVVGHPIRGIKAMGKMFQAAKSQKVFDRWFYDLHNSKAYDVMKESGLAITDPHDPKLAAKEEAFMNNIAQKIPFIGRSVEFGKEGKRIGGLISGSERAYVLFLNKIRVDVFNDGVAAFRANGKTPENSPKLYKALADHVNNITGRGPLHSKIEVASPLLNTLFFAPRLISSRINLLTNWFNPLFYNRVPIEVKKMYAADMVKFVLFGASLLGLAKLAGADVEWDPRSSDGLKIKHGDTRYDILGGFQQYVRLVSEVVTNSRKTKTEETQKLDGEGIFGETKGSVIGRFVRSKLSPVPSMILDASLKRDLMGNKIVYDEFGRLDNKFPWYHPESKYKKEKTWIQEYGGNMVPLIGADIADAFEKQGIKSVATVGLPAAFGVGTMTYSDDKRPKRPTVGKGSKSGRIPAIPGRK